MLINIVQFSPQTISILQNISSFNIFRGQSKKKEKKEKKSHFSKFFFQADKEDLNVKLKADKGKSE